MKGKFIFLMIGVLLTLIALLCVETLAFIALKSKGYSPNFFVNRDFKNKQMKDRPFPFSAPITSIDPHLGYAHDLRVVKSRLKKSNVRLLPGFIQYYNPDKDIAEAFKIVTLGGSTTDGMLVDWSWPEYLFKILDEKGFNVTIYNGGVAGYYSSQEMFKLIRDVLPLNANLIICYNGINDLGYLGHCPDHPYVHPYQRKLCNYLTRGSESNSPLLPSTFTVGRKALRKLFSVFKTKRDVSYGSPMKCTPSKHWFVNVNIMHAVSQRFGIDYICFLQPTLGIGKHEPTADELENLRIYVEQKPKYLERAISFYIVARKKCEDAEFCIDLTDCFEGQSGVYRDATHQTKMGRSLLAQAISTQLINRGLLKHVTNQTPLAGTSLSDVVPVKKTSYDN